MTCTGEANPNNARPEGVTELMGDVVVVCTGGTPTPAGQPIPLYDVTVQLNTNITSRLMTGTSASGGLSEAVLAIDEPWPGANAVPANAGPRPGVAMTQLGCVANNNTNCATSGTGGGVGASGPYNGSPGYPNLFQGSWMPGSPEAITWTGVPIDPPGTQQQRTIRLTNIRANASVFPPGTVSTTSQITATVQLVPESQNPTLGPFVEPVAFVFSGLVACSNFQSSANSTNNFMIQVWEGYPAAFRPRNFAQYGPTGAGGTNTAIVAMPIPSSSANGLQNVLGYAYNSESGFVTGALGLLNDGTSTGAIGLADTGTEISFQLSNVPNGAAVQVPNTIYIYPYGSTVTPTTGAAGATGVAVLTGSAGGLGTTQLSVSGGSATATYEVLYAAAFLFEAAYLPVSISGAPANSPAVSTAVSFAPQSSVVTADAFAPLPRFSDNPVACHPKIPVPQISVTWTGLVYSRVSDTYNSTLTLKNTSGTTVNGPFLVLLSGIPQLYWYGTTNEISVPIQSLSPGQSATAPIQIQAPIGAKITFTPIVYQETSN